MSNTVPTPAASPLARSGYSIALLAACMGRYREHVIEQDERLKRDPSLRKPLKVMCVGDASWEPSAEEVVADMLEDPIRSALKGKVTSIGWKLWTRGGVDLLREVSDAVEDRCDGFSNFAGATLDKWWDGIGDLNSSKGAWVA